MQNTKSVATRVEAFKVWLYSNNKAKQPQPKKMVITLNDIKKALYKEKPIARCILVENDPYNGYVKHTYEASVTIKGVVLELKFVIPGKEAEGFDHEMPAHLLIRWMS